MLPIKRIGTGIVFPLAAALLLLLAASWGVVDATSPSPDVSPSPDDQGTAPVCRMDTNLVQVVLETKEETGHVVVLGVIAGLSTTMVNLETEELCRVGTFTDFITIDGVVEYRFNVESPVLGLHSTEAVESTTGIERGDDGSVEYNVKIVPKGELTWGGVRTTDDLTITATML